MLIEAYLTFDVLGKTKTNSPQLKSGLEITIYNEDEDIALEIN
jgi:hypothetical protein